MIQPRIAILRWCSPALLCLLSACPTPVADNAPASSAAKQTRHFDDPPQTADGIAPEDRVRSGTGVWTVAAPGDTRTATATALCPDCDIVLVTMCSARRDHIDPYVNRGLTPNLAQLAAEGFVFDQAISASNFTLASLTAILTGRFGSSTGVVGWGKGLVSDVPTLPEVLGLYGFTTGGFTVDAASGFRPEYGLDRGFQHLQITDAPSDNPDGRHRKGPTGQGLSVQPLIAWLEAQPQGERLFTMFHTRTAHFPFVVSRPGQGEDPTGIGQLLWGDDLSPSTEGGQMPGVAGGTGVVGVGVSEDPNDLLDAVRRAGPAGLAAWKRYYAEAVRRLDADIGVLVTALEKAGRMDKTILIIVADHGESLGDHEELLHGDSFFDPIVRVPLIVRVPGLVADGQARSSLVSHVDILPTLLDLVGAIPPAGIDGVSFVPVIRNASAQVRGTALVEGGVSWTSRDQLRGAVISPPWTLLRQPLVCGSPDEIGPPSVPGEPFTCLYNTQTDPFQTTNLADQRPEIVAQLQRRWDGFRAAKAGQTVARDIQMDPSFKALLKKSGYFSAVPDE
jgi:arylsulfatase A-like enzyme